MKTPEEYLELAEHYRKLKLDAKDRADRYLLETFERSYNLLAQSGLVLSQSRRAQKALPPLRK